MAEYEMQELSLPNGEGKRVLYPRMVIRQQASLEQIAERIQHASTYSKGEIIGLVQELARQIAAEMAEHSFRLQPRHRACSKKAPTEHT